MAVVNEVVTRFSFQGDLRPQREFNTGLDSSIKLIAGVAAGITAASGAMFAWANSIFNTIDPMVQLSRETGVALESIQELGYAASVNGSSLDAVSASVREMTKRIGEFEQLGTGPAKEVVENLGISFRDANGEIKAADQVMLELTDTMAGMSESERMNVLDKLGIDPSMIQLLSSTSEEVEGLRARAQRLGVVTQEQGGAVASYNDSLTTLRFGMQGIQNMVAVGFAPMMGDLVDRFVNLLEANQDLITNGLNWLGEVVVSTMGMLERMWPVLAAVAVGFAIAKVAAIGFGGVMSIILSPFVLWTAAILGAILIIDDLIVAFQGGESVIADFFESFFGIDIRPALQAIVAVVKETVALVIEVFSPAVDAIKSMFKAVAAIIQGDFGAAWDHIGDAMASMVEFALGLFTTLAEGAGAIMKAVAGLMVEGFMKAFDWVRGVFQDMLDGIMGMWDTVTNYIKGLMMNILPDWAINLISDDDEGSDDQEARQEAERPTLSDSRQTGMADEQAVNLPWTGMADEQAVNLPWTGMADEQAVNLPWTGMADDQAVNLPWTGMADDQAVNLPFDRDTAVDRSTTQQSWNSNIDQNVEVNISTNDPERAGTAVQDALQRQMEDTRTMSNRGGM
jgi:hypothetical protein